MMKFRHAIAVLALGAMMGTGCSCDPVVPDPDGGMGGGTGGGRTGGGTGGGAMGGGGGGATGGGGGATGGGGGAMGGGGGATGGGGGATGGGGGATPVQFTEYVRNLIVTGTNGTSPAAPPADFQALPDDAPITYSQGFFDGGTN
ncbi:MAG: hypothetical protein Q8N23_12070 [Archangium sp.]|nr:hypothetical protein [Archangium sp.]MDP3153404.1 hypothetical protein [Archangium sp.]MDP3573438.1 hypothetical protein [Archangium sp.]